MCGIGGFQSFNANVAGDFLKAVLQQQHTRGPDSQGQFLSHNHQTGLCHNRLAILDLSAAGAQPMQSTDGRYVIVYNGEVYNWQDLRTELSAVGMQFYSGSDTEVLLNAYIYWGENFLTRLNGMFAFAIYDQQEEKIFLARDRIGKKPLLYTETSHGFFFASNLPALLHAPAAGNILNRNGILSGLIHNLSHVPEPFTAYEGIFKLRPGHAMTVSAGKIRRIWRYYNPLAGNIMSSTANNLRALLEDSVQRRMVADVPVASLLSGGVDSSAITAMMQRHTRQPVKTYALGLNADDEDLRRARIMANHIGTDHQEFYFDADRQWDVLGDLLRHHGEPIALLPLVHAAELFKGVHADGARVVLVGHGADELFYGYTGHWRTLMVSLALQFGAGVGQYIPGKWQRLCIAKSGARKAALYQQHAQKFATQVLANPVDFNELISAEMIAWGSLMSRHNYLDESNFVGLMVENLHSIQISADLPAMMHSVETRCPFLDYRIMQFAWHTHWRHKLVPGKYHEQKFILRRAVGDLLPVELLNAPKRGFGFGIRQLALLTQHWQVHVHDILLSDEHNDALGLCPRKIIKIWHDCQAGDAHAATMAFKLLLLKRWLKEKQNG
jgi:asparagine synthase (glutamine-hydrolysing)